MFNNIPTENFHDILCRVPAESLLLSRGVCRSWRQIIDDPAFIKLYTINQQLSIPSLDQLLIRNDQNGMLLSLSLDYLNFVPRRQNIEVTQVMNLVCRGVPSLKTLHDVTSCNGLILFPEGVLWNPLTQEYYELPKCDADMSLECCGVGYDCVNDDYKVVRMDLKLVKKAAFASKTLVYSLKWNFWKQIKDCPYEVDNVKKGHYLNGALYWLSKNFIIALDLSTEDYRQLPLPSLRSEQKDDSGMHLGVMGGCLVFSCKYLTQRFDGWVMKDDGGEISWTELFSVEELEGDVTIRNNIRVKTYSKSQSRVLLQNDNALYWLNIGNKRAKRVQIYGLTNSRSIKFSCHVWQGSLFRLGNIVGAKRIEELVERTKVEKRTGKLNATIAHAWNWL